MFTTLEGWHTLNDGEKLYTKTWKPTEAVKAKVVFVHGFSDHCNLYGPLYPDLANHGIEVFAFDQRGWGRSVKRPSQKGLTGPTSLVLSDLTSILSAHIPSTIPLFLMGHSMGGAEILTYAALGPASTRRHLRGYLAEAPLIALSPETRPWSITVAIGRVAGRWLPWYQMVTQLDAKLLSRDQEVVKQFKADELCHDTGTLEGLAGMLDRGLGLESGEVTIEEEEGMRVSVWIGHGTADGITSFEASRDFFDKGVKVRDKEFKVYEGWYHRLNDEVGEDKHVFSLDVAEWILARTGD